MTTSNPYEYTETANPAVPSDAGGEFPPTPFTLKLIYRGKPCLMSVESDHLVVEGESLPEPIRVLRHERYKLNSCFYFSSGNLILWHRPTRKEFTFRIEERGALDLKISWLFAWKEGVPDERTPEQHVKKISNKWLFTKPAGWLLFHLILFGTNVGPLVGRGGMPFWFKPLLIVFASTALAALILMLFRVKEGMLLAAATIFGAYSVIFVRETVFRLSTPFFFEGGMPIVLLWLTWTFCVMPYIRASRLRRQIRETPAEY